MIYRGNQLNYGTHTMNLTPGLSGTHGAWDAPQSICYGVVCWLPCEVRIEEASCSLGCKGRGNPGILVCKVPHGNSNAPADIHATGHRIIVVPSLGGKTCWGDVICLWEGNIELRNGNLHPEVGVALFRLGLLCTAGGSPDDEMRLEADAVDTDALGFELFDQAVHSLSLFSVIFNAIVIVVELDVLSSGFDGLLGKLERKEEVIWSNYIELFRLA